MKTSSSFCEQKEPKKLFDNLLPLAWDCGEALSQPAHSWKFVIASPREAIHRDPAQNFGA